MIFRQNFPSIIVGGTTDRPYYDGPAYDPARVGCDAPALIRERLEAAQFPVSILRLDSVQNNGVGNAKSSATDLNQDGGDEMLFWTDLPSAVVLFKQHGETDEISLPTLDPYQYADELDTWLLNTDTGLATLDVDFIEPICSSPWPAVYDNIGGMGDGPALHYVTGESTQRANNVQVWSLMAMHA